MVHLNKYIYMLALSLIVVSGLIISCRQNNKETKPTPKSLPVVDKNTVQDERKKWEASPDGISYKEWEVSPEGKKVQASYDKIKKNIKEFSNMEAVVTSVTFQRENAKSSGPKWLIVSIDGENYMMQFIPNEFEHLNSLKVNDKIIVRSRSAGLSPNHPYLIISGDYIEQNKKVLFKREFSKNNGC